MAETTPHPTTSPAIDERAAAVLAHMYKRLKWPKTSGLNVYKPIETDVIITTPIKAGTTLLQYITYLIVYESGGTKVDDFTDINEIAPWVDYHDLMHTPVPSADACTPRVLKSHSCRTRFADAGHANTQKHVVVIRSPYDCAVSFMDFLFDAITADFADQDATHSDEIREKAMNLFAKCELLDIPMESGGRKFLSETDVLHGGDVFDLIRSWTYPTVHSNALVIFYDDVVSDIPGTIKKVAAFANCPLTPAQVTKIVDLCHRDKMANDIRFKGRIGGKLFGFDGSKVNRARPKSSDGFKKYKPELEVVEGINKRLKEEFDVSSYDELKQNVLNQQFELFGR